MAYVGQTSRAIKICLNEHKLNIRLYRSRINSDPQERDERKSKHGETGVAKHFAEMGHHVSDLRWQVVEQVFASSKYEYHSKPLKR